MSCNVNLCFPMVLGNSFEGAICLLPRAHDPQVENCRCRLALDKQCIWKNCQDVLQKQPQAAVASFYDRCSFWAIRTAGHPYQARGNTRVFAHLTLDSDNTLTPTGSEGSVFSSYLTWNRVPCACTAPRPHWRSSYLPLAKAVDLLLQQEPGSPSSQILWES